MRWLGVDVGRRRIGLAISDASATLARPWKTILAASPIPASSAADLADQLAAWRAADDDIAEIGAIVVGLPRRLNGEDNDQTASARQFAEALGARTGLIVVLQDERLTSHEAESRLAVRERDWRRRKEKLDAAAAAIILQDYLDARPHEPRPPATSPESF
jgi:putative holliday junction resolvase